MCKPSALEVQRVRACVGMRPHVLLSFVWAPARPAALFDELFEREQSAAWRRSSALQRHAHGRRPAPSASIIDAKLCEGTRWVITAVLRRNSSHHAANHQRESAAAHAESWRTFCTPTMRSSVRAVTASSIQSAAMVGMSFAASAPSVRPCHRSSTHGSICPTR